MDSFERMINALRRLPATGPRQAERLALHLLRAPVSETEEFIAALKTLKANVKMCRDCFAFSESPLCPICSDASRDPSCICVVEDPQDIAAVERTGLFRGRYHVLHGSISHIEARPPGSLKIAELLARVSKAAGGINEIIIATDPDTDGEATALYLARELHQLVPSITRLAYGMPLGGDLDYTDEMTLGHALRGRVKI